MRPFYAVLIFTATLGAPLVLLPTAGGTCGVQPSTVVVSIGDRFTVSCSYRCDEFQTLFWLNGSSDNSHPVPGGVISSNNYNTSIVQECAGPGTNGTQELSILATEEEIGDLDLIVCFVFFADHVTPCMDSATVNVEIMVVTDSPPPVCEEQQSIDVIIGDWFTLDCTIICGIHQTVLWFIQDMENTVIDTLPEGERNVLYPDQKCAPDDSSTSNVTYRLEVLATNRSAAIENILCMAPITNDNRSDCIVSARFNVTESPTPALSLAPGITESPTPTPSLAPGLTTSTTEKPSTMSTVNGNTDSSHQLLSDVVVLAIFFLLAYVLQ